MLLFFLTRSDISPEELNQACIKTCLPSPWIQAWRHRSLMGLLCHYLDALCILIYSAPRAKSPIQIVTGLTSLKYERRFKNLLQ